MLNTYNESFLKLHSSRNKTEHERLKLIKVKIALIRISFGYLINVCGFLAVCFTNRNTENEGDIAFFLFCGIALYIVLFYALVTFVLVYRIYSHWHEETHGTLVTNGDLEKFIIIYHCLEVLFDIAVLLYSFCLSDWEITEFTTATTAVSCSDIVLNILTLIANCIKCTTNKNEIRNTIDEKTSVKTNTLDRDIVTTTATPRKTSANANKSDIRAGEYVCYISEKTIMYAKVDEVLNDRVYINHQRVLKNKLFPSKRYSNNITEKSIFKKDILCSLGKSGKLDDEKMQEIHAIKIKRDQDVS